MKRSEFKKQIEEIITEILKEDVSSLEANAKKSEIAAAQEAVKDATTKLQNAATLPPLEKKAAQDALNLAKDRLKKALAVK